MNKLTSIILILFLSLLSSPSWSETLTIDDLLERNDLFYKKYTDVPFTGEVSGMKNGKFKNGMKVGEWLTYDIEGQLNGEWLFYRENGQLKEKGNYKDDVRVGRNQWYYENGVLNGSRNYSFNTDCPNDPLGFGCKHGLEEIFWENGVIGVRTNFKNNLETGTQETFDEDGTIKMRLFYQDGVQQGKHEFYDDNGKLIEEFIYKDGDVIQIIRH